jgi:hypothetical protein
MRSMFVASSVLLLLSAVFSSVVQASSIMPDASRLGYIGLLDQFASPLGRSSRFLFAPNSAFTTSLSADPTYFNSAQPVIGEEVFALGQRSSAAVFGRLLRVSAPGRFAANVADGGLDLGRSVSSVTPPGAVPLSAAIWLFASALLGFVAVANRRRL